MPDKTPPSKRPDRSGPKRSLVERVEGQVQRASRALERRDGATRPRARRKPTRNASSPSASRNGPKAASSNGSDAAAPASREMRALRTVYHDLGARHRRYRKLTGESVSPALRAAVSAFKQEPSLLSLIPVAGFLDELDLLDW